MSWQLTLHPTEAYQLDDPPFYLKTIEPEQLTHPRHQPQQMDIIYKKLYSVSVEDGQQVFMMLFMMYMVGNDLSIFTIIFLLNFLSMPFKGLTNFNNSVSLWYYKLIFLTIRLVMILIAGYKLSKMGLLPTSAADWLDIIPNQHPTMYVLDITPN